MPVLIAHGFNFNQFSYVHFTYQHLIANMNLWLFRGTFQVFLSLDLVMTISFLFIIPWGGNDLVV